MESHVSTDASTLCIKTLNSFAGFQQRETEGNRGMGEATNNSSGEEKVTYIFKRKNCSGFREKKKLVKTMMLEHMVDSVTTLLRNCCWNWKHHPNKGGEDPEPPKPAGDKNEKKIFPFQP